MHMKDTRLMKVIEQFSVAELRQLKKFVDSPYFNTNKNVCALLDFIRKYERDFKHEKFTQEYAAHYVFPDLKPDISAITRLQSKLFKLVEKFIYYNFKDEEPDIELVLMKFYYEKNLIPHFNSIHRRAQNIQGDYPYKDATYYYNQFRIETLYTGFQVAKIPGSQPDYQALIRALDIAYFIQKLTSFCQILNYQRVAVVDFDMTLMDEILDFLPKSPYRDIPVIQLWHTALLLLKFPDQTEHYYQLKDLLYQYDDSVSIVETRMLYTYLHNTTRVIFKDRPYYEALFELYTAQLQNGVIYINGYLLPTSLKNIVTVALRLEQVNWTEEFLVQHKDKILPEYEDKDNVYSYSLARLYIEQKKIDPALGILNQIVSTDFYTNMSARKARLMVYYEVEYVDMFESEVNRFRVYLTNNQETIPQNWLQAYRDFTNIIYNIYNTTKRDTDRLNQLKNQINDIQMLPEKKWLLEKLEALK